MKSKNPKPPIPALVSIHDVMPDTLHKVDRILDTLRQHDINNATLLVVPGKSWQEKDIDQLRQYAQQGYELAGHGWQHQVTQYGGLIHRLHGLIISRNVAEHLALDSAGISQLIERCYQWFIKYNLPAPSLYVPPAWAMGGISRSRLRRLPFRYYEYFSGIYDSKLNCFERIPMVGYEADAWYRVPFVALWNSLNFKGAQHQQRLRFSIHPNDFELFLRKSLARDLCRVVPKMLPSTPKTVS
ncbi:polysaccharide deacetylase family protein [Kaarinaea lacus]